MESGSRRIRPHRNSESRQTSILPSSPPLSAIYSPRGGMRGWAGGIFGAARIR